MDLARSNSLWLLAFVPLLLAWVWRGRRRRAIQWSALGQGGRLRGDGAAGWLAAIVCLIVSLAQPRWGRVPAPPLPPGRDVVLLVDTSRSMGAEDAVPDRLGLAVEAAVSLVEALGREAGNRVAVVAFAGRGVLRCPLTENLGAVVETLRALRPGDVRPGGTDLGAALTASLDAFGAQEQAGGRTIVVFSDGEDHAARWDATIERLGAAGIIVHAVAVGDAEHGHPVPSGPGKVSLKYQGAQVLSRRSDQPLAALAQATGGALVPLGLAPADLGSLYLSRIEPVALQNRLVVRTSERAEQFPWLVLAALGVGLAGSRPGPSWRELRPKRGLRWLGLIALLGLVMGAGKSTESTTAGSAVEAGRLAYRAGRWAEALAAFERASALEPGAAVPHYNAGAALFQMQRYEEAFEQYQAARGLAGAGLRTKIDYALGNTALALGDVAGAIWRFDACIASNASGTDLDAVRRDASINRRFAAELARRIPASPDPDDGSSSSPRTRPPRKQGGDEANPDHSASGAARPASVEDAPGQGTSGRRGTGGAGGSGAAPPQPGSPEDRLNIALERVRETRRRRLPEPPLPVVASDDHKDW